MRDLSPETVHNLKGLAKRNQRSLQAEAKLILEQAATRYMSPERRLELFALIEQIRERSGPQTSDSTELIREDRER